MTDMKDILTENKVEYKNTNSPAEILIECTSGTHKDHNPSLQYNLEKNIFKCWSCGFHGGQKKFLASIGIYQEVFFESKQTYRIEKLKRRLKGITETDITRLPPDKRPVLGSFKNINKGTLEDFDAFFTLEYGLDDYVCIPVYQFGHLRFIEGRNRFKTEKKPKYLRRPVNSRVRDILFPLDKLDQKQHLIFVEGIFDMLNLWQYGINNVVCIFGTQNFGKDKLELLEKIGTISVVLFFDGDEPGRISAKKISDMLERINIQTNIINLPDGVDPGMLSENSINSYLRIKNDRN